MKNRLLLLATVLLVILPPLATFRIYLGMPPLSLVVAMVPAAILSGIVLLLGRSARASWTVLAGVFLWGALIAAFLAWTLNDLVMLLLVRWSDGERARALTPTLAAPAIEELAKATSLALLLLVRRPWSVRTGILCGALVGIGFAMTENTQYFLLAMVAGGLPGLWQALYTRALLGGLNHAMFSAFAGAGIASARLGWAVAGLAVAMALHILWNAVASDEITQLLCNPEVPGGACRGTPSLFDLAVVAPLIELALLVPGGLVLRALWNRDERG